MSEILPRSLVRVEGAAAMCGLSVSTLNKLRIKGNGPPYSKLGRAVVYDPVDIDEWVKSRRRTSTSEV